MNKFDQFKGQKLRKFYTASADWEGNLCSLSKKSGTHEASPFLTLNSQKTFNNNNSTTKNASHRLGSARTKLWRFATHSTTSCFRISSLTLVKLQQLQFAEYRKSSEQYRRLLKASPYSSSSSQVHSIYLFFVVLLEGDDELLAT